MATTRAHSTETSTQSFYWLTPSEMQTLEALCEALIPATPPPSDDDDIAAHGLYARSAADLGLARLVADTLADESPETRAEFKKLLGTLNQPLVGMLLAGRPRGFTQLTPVAREAALRKMASHPMAQMRQGFQALKRLAMFIFYAAPVAEGRNPNWPALDYTPPPAPPSPEAAPKRIRALPVTSDLTLTADAVVIGSGPGGALVAAQLTTAGKDVIILEKGGYHNEADFTGVEADMTRELFLRRGSLSTRDLGVVVLAGSTLGGGSIVNWSTSLRTPPDVLAEWERNHGLTGATTAEFQHGFEVAEKRIGVNTADSAPNPNNAALQRGCDTLGYEWKPIPRNASDCQQRCGACGYGCPHGRKQSTMLTFLQDASDGGARTVVRCTVQRVLIEAGRAVGVEGWAPDTETSARRTITVRAPIVVVAAGSVESPALLLRSGLTNPNIGRHLRLHPVAVVTGYYDESIKPWTGSLQTVYSRDKRFSHLKDNYGLWFEAAPAHPGLMGLTTPWDGGQSHKRLMRRAPNEAVFIALTRDTGEGQITLDRHGDPVLNYWPNETDRRHLTRGMQELARIAFAGGAIGASTLHTPPLQLESEGGKPGAVTDANLQHYLNTIEQRGVVLNRVPLFSAHQMGSCRLGSDAKTAVADPYGEVYGVRGLFIGDASGCPTALGVNPMLTTMALAYRVAQHIISRS